MKILILYDSLYCNTEKIAQSIASGFLESNKVKVLHVEEATLNDLEDVELLIVSRQRKVGGQNKVCRSS